MRGSVHRMLNYKKRFEIKEHSFSNAKVRVKVHFYNVVKPTRVNRRINADKEYLQNEQFR